MPLPTGQDVLTEVLRDGARRMLAQAIEAEVAAWIDAHAHLKDEAGHKLAAQAAGAQVVIVVRDELPPLHPHDGGDARTDRRDRPAECRPATR